MDSKMRPEAFQWVDVTSGTEAFPLRSLQGAPTAPSLVHLTFLATLAAAVVVPQLGLAGYAMQSPEIRRMILDQPVVAFQLVIALVFWICLFAWPLKGLAARLTCRRAVEITKDHVNVADTAAFSRATWSAPLASYRGIAHNIRSSLSGTRHELVLVHPDVARSVLLVAADTICDAEITRMVQLLRLPQVPASTLYGRRGGARPARSIFSRVPASG